MGRPLPAQPGWYVSPDDPGALRYWDGTSWSGRSRPRPPWTSRADELEVDYSEVDRSVEGPVHPQQMREHAFSAAREWSLLGLARRSDQARRSTSGPWSRSSRSPGWQPPPKLGPARRPLLVIVSMVVIAVAVVVSSVAVMAPYRAPGTVMDANARDLAEFAALASRECQATLPKYRTVLADDIDGPSIMCCGRPGRPVAPTPQCCPRRSRDRGADRRMVADLAGLHRRPTALCGYRRPRRPLRWAPGPPAPPGRGPSGGGPSP